MKALAPAPAKPAPRKSYSKSTEGEREKRISWCEWMLRKRPYLKWTLIRKVKEEFLVSTGQAQLYIAHARERLVLALNETKQDHRAEVLGLLRGVLTNADSTQGDRIKAINSIVELLGLAEAHRLNVNVDANLTATVSETPLSSDELSKALDLPTRIAMLKGLRSIATQREQQEREKNIKQLLPPKPAIDV